MRNETYECARKRLLSELRSIPGVLVSGELKYPWFEIGGKRFWFKAQGVVSGVHVGNRVMGKGLSCWVDFRCMSLDEFACACGFAL